VNSRGDAIGDSTLPGDVEDHAFLWSQGKLYDLGTLGGTKSLPIGLTEDGHVSGMSRTTNVVGLAFQITRTSLTTNGGRGDENASEPSMKRRFSQADFWTAGQTYSQKPCAPHWQNYFRVRCHPLGILTNDIGAYVF
jgi:probable HAF family extracellular repeat protein